jgi:hypothetical protein
LTFAVSWAAIQKTCCLRSLSTNLHPKTLADIKALTILPIVEKLY